MHLTMPIHKSDKTDVKAIGLDPDWIRIQQMLVSDSEKCLDLDQDFGRTDGAVCKVSYSLARATHRSWVQAPAAILARF